MNCKPDGPLSPDERRRLVEDWLKDYDPVRTLTARYPAVVQAAWAWGLTHDEVRSACHLGLMSAARLFDPARGLKFVTLVMPWVRQAVTREVWARVSGGFSGTANTALIGKVRAPVTVELVDGLVSSPEQEDDSEVGEAVADTLAEVGGREAEALRLRLVDGWPMGRIGHRLGVSRQAAAKVCERAVRLVKPRLAKRLGVAG